MSRILPLACAITVMFGWSQSRAEPPANAIAGRQKYVDSLLEALQDNDAETRRAAALALGEATWAVDVAAPALIEKLGDREGRVRAGAEDGLIKMGYSAAPHLLLALKNEDVVVRLGVVGALGGIGPPAKAAIPYLMDFLADKDLCWTAAEALGRIGRDAIPRLCDALKNQDALVRRAACKALGRIGAEGGKTVPALVSALQDNDESVQWDAVNALGEIGPLASGAVPALARLLANDEIGFQVALALARMGPAAHQAVPALTTALTGNCETRRSYAALALGEIGPAAREAIPALKKALNDPYTRVEAACALCKIDPAEALPAIPVILDYMSYALQSSCGICEAGTRAEIRNLLRIGPKVLPHLIQGLKGKDSLVRDGCATLLAELGTDARPALPALIDALDDPNGRTRCEVVSAIGAIGPEAKAAIPRLKAHLVTGDPQLRVALAKALWKTEGGPDEYLRVVVPLIRDKDSPWHSYAIHSLYELGPSAKPAVPALLEALKTDRRHRSAILEALAAIDREALAKALAL